MPQTATTINGTQPTAILLADFDADAKLDFATADRNGPNATVRLGNGSGDFGLGQSITAVNAPIDLVAADFSLGQGL